MKVGKRYLLERQQQHCKMTYGEVVTEKSTGILTGGEDGCSIPHRSAHFCKSTLVAMPKFRNVFEHS